MRSVNKVILIGNLTRDPEMRQTPNGQSVTTFGVATNREWMTKDGERKQSAEFHECVAWAKLAEICAKILRKGNLVHVEGYLKTRSWDTPEGVRKFKTEIVVQDMITLEKRRNNEEGEEYVPQTEGAPEREHEHEEQEEEEAQEEATVAEEKEPAPHGGTKEPKKSSKKKDKDENPIDKDLGL